MIEEQIATQDLEQLLDHVQLKKSAQDRELLLQRELAESKEENKALIQQQQALKVLFRKAQGDVVRLQAESKEHLQKLKHTQEALTHLDQQNRIYRAELGGSNRNQNRTIAETRETLDQEEFNHFKEQIATLREQNIRLAQEGQQLREELWLTKETLKNIETSNDRGAAIAEWVAAQKQEQIQEQKPQQTQKDEHKEECGQQCHHDHHDLSVHTPAKEAHSEGEMALTISCLLKEKQESEKELETMKQTVIQSSRETRELKEYYQRVMNEKTAILHKNQQMQKSLQEMRGVIAQKEQELEVAKSQLEVVKGQLCGNEQQIESERELQRRLEKKVQERDENLSSFKEQIKSLQDKIKSLEEVSREKERSVIEAHQHLAKKMKEHASVEEKFEEQKREIIRLQDEQVVAIAKVADAQVGLNSAKETEKKLKEQISSWEEKYFFTNERLQEAEAKNKELRKLEERHEQMQQLLTNLGNVMGAPVALIQAQHSQQHTVAEVQVPPNTPTRQHIPQQSTSENRQHTEQVKQQQTLFDVKQQQRQDNKYKKDLFERYVE